MTLSIFNPDSMDNRFLYDYFMGYKNWRVCRSDFLFLKRWKVYDPGDKFIASFADGDVAIKFCEFMINETTPPQE